MGSNIATTIRPAEAGGAHGAVQDKPVIGGGKRAAGLICVGLTGVLAACSSVPTALNPVEWWHGLQGGRIAEQRPPPPGADDPYPNLGTVPPRPAPSDPKLRQQIADALIADRGNAQHDAAGVQLVDPSNPNAAPGLFGRGTARPPAPPPPGGASASFPGTDATAAAPNAPPPMATERTAGVARAPVGAVRSAPLAEPAEQPETERPALPTAPPAPANLPGAPASAAVPPDRPASAVPSTTIAAQVTPSGATPTADAAAVASIPASAPTSAPSTAAPTGRSVGVPFAVGSAVVPRPSIVALRQLAARRAGGTIAVTGFGEASGSDAADQSPALSLALARAQAVAGALTTLGVPASFIRVDAEAAGRGAAARLVE